MKKLNENKTRINLLPAADKERFVKNKKRLVIFTVIIVYGLFIFLLDLTLYIQNSSKNSYIFKLNQELMLMKTRNVLNKSLESAIDSRKKLNEALNKRLLVVKILKGMRVVWNRKITEMVAASPKGVWMSGLLLDNGIITINGNSISLNGISAYMDRLKETRMFDKIVLAGAGRKIISGNTFYQFKLKAVLASDMKQNIISANNKNKK